MFANFKPLVLLEDSVSPKPPVFLKVPAPLTVVFPLNWVLLATLASKVASVAMAIELVLKFPMLVLTNVPPLTVVAPM